MEEQLQDNNLAADAKSKKITMISEIIMLAFTFIVIPIVSVMASVSTDLAPFAVTLSQIAWFHDKLWVVYVWGAISLFPLIFNIYNVCKIGNYTKVGTIVFTAASFFALVVAVTGLSISSAKGDYLRLIHVGFCTAGFVLFLFIILGLTFSMIRRNRTAFILSLGLDCFLLISGLYFVFTARSFENNNVSAMAEVYCFMMYNVVTLLDYYLLKFVPASGKREK